MGFKKTKEDFTCEHCGAFVQGDGYTNHCPRCLWSKHVDNTPGDRAALCEGMMKPLRIEGTTPHYRIIHECERCKHLHPNSVRDIDSADAVIALAKNR